MEQFMQLSNLAFHKGSWLDLPFNPFKSLRSFLDMLISFTTDSRYPSLGIEQALKAAFGDTQKFFENSGGGTKVAIVASTTRTSSTCIIANYNGQEKRSQECGRLIFFHNSLPGI
jgi:hypothetical protein